MNRLIVPEGGMNDERGAMRDNDDDMRSKGQSKGDSPSLTFPHSFIPLLSINLTATGISSLNRTALE